MATVIIIFSFTASGLTSFGFSFIWTSRLIDLEALNELVSFSFFQIQKLRLGKFGIGVGVKSPSTLHT